MTRDLKKTRWRVWVFLMLSVVALVVAVYAIGEKSGLFERGATLYAYFEDLDGLVVGAPVRLSGLDIGTVSSVEFPAEIEERKARVRLSIKARYLPRIRRDSTASIGSKGLLGDKLVDISAGTPGKATLPDGATLVSDESETLTELTGSVKGALGSIRSAADQAKSAIEGLVTERAGADVQRALAALADLAEAARDNKGVFHTMIYDDQAGEDARKVIHELATTVAAAHSAATRLDALLARIEQGPGGAYALLYGQEGITIAENLAQTSDDIKTVMGDARNGQGLLHELVYGTDGPKAISELAQASERLDRIMATIEAGEGTLGGLLVDPTVYEDLKTLIGNIDRNVLLKALVRFAIKEGDIRRPAVRPPQKKKSEGAAEP